MKANKCIDSDKPETIVPSPAWLQRWMVRNLQKAAKERVGAVRAQKARAILKQIGVSIERSPKRCRSDNHKRYHGQGQKTCRINSRLRQTTRQYAGIPTGTCPKCVSATVKH